jgi:hypothetical protein
MPAKQTRVFEKFDGHMITVRIISEGWRQSVLERGHPVLGGGRQFPQVGTQFSKKRSQS